VGRTVSAAQDVLNGVGSLNNTLRLAGFVTRSAHRMIHALPAPKEIAGHLHVKVSHPLLRIRSRSWDQNDTLFDYYETWVLTDVVSLEVDVAAS
jgi:GntR family transcriptional regulator